MASGGRVVDPEILTAVASACRDDENARLDHVSHDGATTLRTAEPYRLAVTGHRRYPIAHVEGTDWRTIRLDRFRLRTPDGPRCVPRELPGTDVPDDTSCAASRAASRAEGGG
jgi:predicted DNA-binding transcriptional regulator YafY